MKAVSLLAAALSLAATPALAHPGHLTGGLAAGLAHPLLGDDHLLAMLSLGLWTGLRQGRGSGWPAAAFLAAMAAGAVAARMLLLPAPVIEPLVLATVLAAALLLMSSARVPTWGAVALMALLGSVHGAAHGLEAGRTGDIAAFGLGALAATALLIGGGFAVARLGLAGSPRLARLIGAGSLAASFGLVLVGGQA